MSEFAGPILFAHMDQLYIAGMEELYLYVVHYNQRVDLVISYRVVYA